MNDTLDTSPEAVEGDWLLEQQAFDAANHSDVPEWARDTVKRLWEKYCQLAKERGEARNAALSEAIEAMKGRTISDNLDAIAVLKALITPKPDEPARTHNITGNDGFGVEAWGVAAATITVSIDDLETLLHGCAEWDHYVTSWAHPSHQEFVNKLEEVEGRLGDVVRAYREANPKPDEPTTT